MQTPPRTLAKRKKSKHCNILRVLRHTMLSAVGLVRHSFVFAAFVLGPSSSKCPPNFFPLDTESACNLTARLANRTYGGSLVSPDGRSHSAYPARCFWHTVDGGIYFNGEGTSVTVNSFALQLCAGAPIPALPCGRRWQQYDGLVFGFSTLQCDVCNGLVSW